MQPAALAESVGAMSGRIHAGAAPSLVPVLRCETIVKNVENVIKGQG